MRKALLTVALAVTAVAGLAAPASAAYGRFCGDAPNFTGFEYEVGPAQGSIGDC